MEYNLQEFQILTFLTIQYKQTVQAQTMEFILQLPVTEIE